jgi:hypothetical protein
MSMDVLDQLKALGVQVVPDGGDLVFRPASKVPPQLKERLKAEKAQILALLARPAEAVRTADCAHCEGRGACDCPACTLRRVTVPVPCSMCKWVEHRSWLAATRPRECWHCEERRLSGEPGPCANCAKGNAQIQ